MVKRPHTHTVNHVATLRCDVSLTVIRTCFRCCCFSDITISQGSVATHVRCGGILHYCFTINLLLKAKSVGKRILKIGKQLAKLEAKI